jgi:hypothetical protein
MAFRTARSKIIAALKTGAYSHEAHEAQRERLHQRASVAQDTNMKILKAGDRGEALARERGRVPIVYAYRTVHLEASDVDVPNVLVGVCEETGEVLVIPAQSAPRLKEARETVKDETFPVRLPAQLSDVLCLLADHFDVGTKKFLPALIRFYLGEAVRDRRLARRLGRLAGHDLALEGPKLRITLRTDADLLDRVDRLASELDGVSRSDLVRGAILAAKEDVLDGRAARRTESLKAVARAV